MNVNLIYPQTSSFSNHMVSKRFHYADLLRTKYNFNCKFDLIYVFDLILFNHTTDTNQTNLTVPFESDAGFFQNGLRVPKS